MQQRDSSVTENYVISPCNVLHELCVDALMSTYCIRLEGNFYLDVIFKRQASILVHLTDNCFMSPLCIHTSASRRPAKQNQRAAREDI